MSLNLLSLVGRVMLRWSDETEKEKNEPLAGDRTGNHSTASGATYAL
jgi:hypothetical protein